MLAFKIGFEFGQGLWGFVNVFEEAPFFEQDNSIANFGDVHQIMARYQKGRLLSLGHARNQFFESDLGSGIKIGKRFVQNNGLRHPDQGGNDSYFFLIALREVPQVFFFV